MDILIKPVIKEFPLLKITNVLVSLEKDAQIYGTLESGESLVIPYQLFMDQATYDQWGDNDEYVINWVLTQLGLERA